MKNREQSGNLLDELAADAPIGRMRSRFAELMARTPRESRRPPTGLAWAAAAVLVVAGLLVLGRRPPTPEDLDPRAQVVLELLRAPSTFERLRGVNAAADLQDAVPSLRSALLDRLELDDSVNVRLSALGVLVGQDLATQESDRLIRALLKQETAIVQAHLGYGLRRRHLLSRSQLDRVLQNPGIQGEARTALTRLEES